MSRAGGLCFNLLKWLIWPGGARVLHVMHNDKFNRAFIDLVREHFGEQHHLFLFYGGASESEFEIPKYRNVIVLRGRRQLRWLLAPLLKVAKKTIFHGLLIHDLVHFLSRRSRWLRNSCWVIWGADLYPDKAVVNSDYFRAKKEVVQHLGAIGVVARGDFQIARDLYDLKGECYYALYKNPIEKQWLDCATKAQGSLGTITIQINNSADESVIGVLEKLACFKDRPVKIRVVLSYGNPEVKGKILEKGRSIFGKKFEPLTQYLSPKEYGRLIAECDVLVMNQPRQQGLGNIYAFLYCGGKVYVRSDVSSWEFLREKGFEIFDTLKLNGQSFEEFIRLSDADRKSNSAIAARLFDENHIAGLWSEVFFGSGNLPACQKQSGLQAARERRAREFDWKFYTQFYPDLASVRSEEEALKHWIGHGWAEGRIAGMGCEKFISNQRELDRYIQTLEPSPTITGTSGPLIHILTRTHRRPLFFAENRKSVEEQTYKNYRHLVSYENTETWAYLKESTVPGEDLIKVIRRGSGSHPYNLFVNDMMDLVAGGWVMFLDDDDLFTTPYALSIIASHLTDEDNLVIWRTWFPDKIVPRRADCSNIVEGQITSSCFAFHIKHKEKARWHDKRAGDYQCFDQLRKRLKPVFLDAILAKTNYTSRSAGWGQANDKEPVVHSAAII